MLKFFIFLSFLCYGFSLRANFQTQNTNKEIKQSTYLHHKRQHNYYNLQETKRVSASKSIKYLNQCKALCLEMHQLFPFQFKYHRLVYRQQDGDMKYITGECFYAFRPNSQDDKNSLNKKQQNQKAQKSDKSQNTFQSQKKWYNWKNIKSFIQMSIIEDAASREQRKAWQSYSKDCEDNSLRLSESSRIDFKFTIVHSDFQYYQNEGFKNLQPFDDLDGLVGGLAP